MAKDRRSEIPADKPLPSETILADDYPVFLDYVYLVDGRPRRCPLMKGTVRDLRRALNAQEVRRCDLCARGFFK